MQVWRGGTWLALAPCDRGPDALLAGERVLAQPYSGERLQQFCSGRALARQLLRQMRRSGSVETADEPVIGRGEYGEPLWPPGVVGSISHSGAQVAVLLGEAAEWHALAVDIEQRGRVLPELWPLLFTSVEQHRLANADGRDRDGLATAFFCIKEAFLKLPSRYRERVQDYRDIEVISSDRRLFLQGSRIDLRPHVGCSRLPAELQQQDDMVIAGLFVE